MLQSSSDADTSPGAALCSGGSCCSSVRGFPAWLCRAAADHTLGCGSALPPDVMLFSFHGRLPLLLCFFILCNISAFSLYPLRCFYFCACCCYQWHSNARNRFKISKKSPVWLEPLVQSLVTFQGAFKRFKSKSEMVPVSWSQIAGHTRTFSLTQETALSDNSCLNADCCCASPISLYCSCMSTYAKLWQELSLLVHQHYPAAALPVSVSCDRTLQRGWGSSASSRFPRVLWAGADVTAAGDEPPNERH